MKKYGFYSLIILSFFIVIPANGNFCNDSDLVIFHPNIKADNNKIHFGKILSGALFLGDKKILNFTDSVKIELTSPNNTVEMAGDEFVSPVIFLISSTLSFFQKNVSWALEIYDEQLNLVDSKNGKGSMPERIIWKKDIDNKKIIPDKSYFFKLVLTMSNNQIIFKTSPKPFIIVSVASIKHKIKAGSFSSYDKILSDNESQQFLTKVSHEIKTHPEEKLNIVAYTTKDNPDLCKNLLRLRNYLVVNADIPLERFQIFCDYVANSKENSKHITISGTKPIREVAIKKFTPPLKTQLKIDEKWNVVSENKLFLLHKTKKVLSIKTNSGEELFFDLQNLGLDVPLKKGKNLLGASSIILEDGPPHIYCGNYKKPTLKIKLGFGPYYISDTLKPKDFHIGKIGAYVDKDIDLPINLFPFSGGASNKFTFSFEFNSVPVSLAGKSRSNQKIYDFTPILFYKIISPSLIFSPGLGYFYYLSNDNYFANRELNRELYSPMLFFNIEFLNKLVNSKISFENRLGFSPFLRKDSSSYRLKNSLFIYYSINFNKSLFLEYKKNIFRYKNRAREEYVIENLDALLLGLKITL